MLQWTHPGHIYSEVVKQFPDVVAGVDLFHLHFCVYIAVVHKVYIGNFHLHDTEDIPDLSDT